MVGIAGFPDKSLYAPEVATVASPVIFPAVWVWLAAAKSVPAVAAVIPLEVPFSKPVTVILSCFAENSVE